jgi:hypothetical protein
MRQPGQSWLLILEKRRLMMGGLLSTRWADHHKRGVVEDCLEIDAHEVARQGGRRADRVWDGQRPWPIYYCIESVPEDAEQLQVAINLPNRAESQVARLEITAPLGRSCLGFESRSRAGQKKRRIW